jgi:hypothetical protein
MPAKNITKKIPARRATLRSVATRAAKDRRFFAALIRDPDRALSAAGLKLAPNDRRALARMVRRGRVRLDLKIRDLRRFAGAPADWQWRGAWPWRP